MILPLEKKDHKHTYGDYYKWTGDERWELIKGVPYDNDAGADCDTSDSRWRVIQAICQLSSWKDLQGFYIAL